ncbi:hypothetical protein [Streptomyces sp. Root369]|uniref:hypothetical protein n=1 Tax=Streptomyces sp. Root369 TaxID=1736523 RepID=UPI00070B54AC|nr:hypothetical protein [Streptomyces sp. Root369]KQV98776.1 hypothetical protein ASD08_09930 [Streptomyces sp. Root369]
MTDAVSGAGEERKGRTTGDPSGARSPMVAPTETEAPDARGSATGRPTGVPRGAEEDRGGRGERREPIPGAMTPPGRGDEGGFGADSVPGRDKTSGLGRGTERGRDAGSDTVGGVGTGVGGSSSPESHEARLLPHEETDKLSTRLQHAVAGFVDEPRSAVEEADHVLEEVAARFTDAVTQRRRTLRNSWQTGDGGRDDKAVGAGDTEQLRLALRDYRELTERLLHS